MKKKVVSYVDKVLSKEVIFLSILPFELSKMISICYPGLADNETMSFKRQMKRAGLIPL